MYAVPMPFSRVSRTQLTPRLFLSGLFLAFSAALHAAPAADKDAPHFPTTDDLRHLKAFGSPQLSPDGSQVLFTVTSSTADGAASHLWIVSTSGDKDTLRQLTFGTPSDKRGERGAQWSPDGKAIFFLAHRGEHTQLFRLDLRGGEAQPYDLKILPPIDDSKEKNFIPPPGADKNDKKDEKKAEKKSEDKKDEKKDEQLPIDVSSYSISEDGKWLTITARDPQTPGEKKGIDAKADAEWINHETHGTRLYLAALKPGGGLESGPDGSLKAVSIASDVREAIWSPAVGKLFVITEPPNDLSDLGPVGKAFIVDASTPDKPEPLQSIPPTISGGDWSSDGGKIVFAAATPEDAPPGVDELYLLPSLTAAKPVSLTSGFTGSVRGGTLYFPPSEPNTLITDAGIGTRSSVIRIALDGSSKPAPIDLGAPFIGSLNTNRKQTGWVWTAQSGGQPAKLCYAVKLGSPCTPLPLPELAPANLQSVEPQVVSWTGNSKSGKFTIEGLLYLPPQAQSGKVPLIVDVHGGPLGAWGNRHDAFADFLLGHGWAILRPNPRGSSNYGVAFAAANKNDLGGGDYEDIMAGVDYVLSKYPLDPAKMALIGYSYGGEMAGFVEGKTDRFKAIISGAPVIDQFSEYGTEGGSWYDRWYFGKPWEHLEDAWRQSPLSGAAKAKTPFLLIQGQADTTDPVGQALEMYRALRQEGVPVELVTYPRENHGPLATGIYGSPSPEPWHGYDGRQHIIDFLNKAFGVKE